MLNGLLLWWLGGAAVAVGELFSMLLSLLLRLVRSYVVILFGLSVSSLDFNLSTDFCFAESSRLPLLLLL